MPSSLRKRCATWLQLALWQTFQLVRLGNKSYTSGQKWQAIVMAQNGLDIGQYEIKLKGWNVAKATYINFLVVESRQKKMPGSDTDSPKNLLHPDERQHSICMVTDVISYLPDFPPIKTK